MFTAITETGEIINLFNRKEKDDLTWLRHTPLYCPECKGRVLLKMGEKKITHFAHERIECCSSNGEAESRYHLQGKLQLYQKLAELNLHPQLEPYYPEIKQRADISFVFHNKQYVIEYQCAVISPQLIKKRTDGYRKVNIHPIWIIGFCHLKKWNPIKLKLSAFIYQFFILYRKQYLLLSYCPNNRAFYLIQNPIPISISQSFVTTFFYPLVKIEREPPLIPIQKWHFAYWREIIHQQKTKDVHYPTRTNTQFLKELYTHEFHPHFLPPFIGIPLKEGFLLETPPLYWQATIFLDNFKEKKKIYPLQKIYANFHKRIKSRQIKGRNFPFITETDWRNAVKQYLDLLVKLKVIEEVKPQFYRMLYKKNIRNYEHQELEEAMFYKQLKNLFNKQ